MSERQQYNKLYTLADIELYLLGRLSPAEMHAIERVAIMDPLLADAIEGYRYAGADKSSIQNHLFDIRQQLLNQQDQQTKPVIGKLSRPRWWRIAAAVIVLAGIGSIGLYVIEQTNSKKEIAEQNVPVLKKSTPNPTQPATPDKPKVQPPAVAQPVQPATALVNANKKVPPPVPEPLAAASLKKAETEILPAVPKNDSAGNALALADVTPKAVVKETGVTLYKSEGRVAGVSVGPKPTNIILRGTSNLKASRKDSVPDLAEIVVVDHNGKAKEKRSIIAPSVKQTETDSLGLVPETGWDSFNAYFAKEAGPDIHGELVATVLLDENGKAKDLTIIRSFDRSLDPFSRSQKRKFKKIILAGPVWLINGNKREGSYRLEIEF